MNEKFDSKENKFKSNYKQFLGYFLPTNPVVISITAIFAALTCVLTMIISIPIPATQGYINIGDAAVMITGLLFGPIIGGLAGGIGSMLADIFLGYTIYAPATLIIKGLEGFLVGFISDPKNREKLHIRDFIAVIIGGMVMVLGYFLYEIILWGVEIALIEVFLNGIIQFGLGATIAIIFTLSARKNITDSLNQVFEKVFVVSDS
ncbi:MAG: ECF transporter S component [Promethearchaeia archaeon]